MPIKIKFKKNLGCVGSSSGSTWNYVSRGPEFESQWELGFFLLFPFSLNQWCVLNQVPRVGATLLSFNFPTKIKPKLYSLR